MASEHALGGEQHSPTADQDVREKRLQSLTRSMHENPVIGLYGILFMIVVGILVFALTIAHNSITRRLDVLQEGQTQLKNSQHELDLQRAQMQKELEHVQEAMQQNFDQIGRRLRQGVLSRIGVVDQRTKRLDETLQLILQKVDKVP